MPASLPFFANNDLVAPSESEQRILGLTFRSEVIAQPSIAKETGLAQQSVSRLVKGLLDRGALTAVDRSSHGKRGQPGMNISIAPKFAYTFGVSMMTDALSIALLDFAGNVLQQRHHDLPAMTRQAVISAMRSSFEEMTAAARIRRKSIVGLGVGISGYCLDGKARYNTPRLLDEWALVDIDRLLADELGMPVLVENDGNAAAIGESLVGHGRTYPNFVYVYLAAGIGGGVINERELIRGSNGNGGELGLILPSHIHPFPTMDLLRQMLTQRGLEFDGLSDMLNQFDPDWPGVDAWVAKTSEAFSMISSAIAALFDPHAIVLGGRIPSRLARKLIPHIEIYDDARRAEPRPLPRFFVSEVEGDAAAIGAATLPFKKYFFAST